jgi:phosphomannomutase
MTLIKSISGIRGTIGGREGTGLTPIDIVKFTSAFAQLIGRNTDNRKIVIGRDARISGEMVNNLVCGTLCSMGFDVFDAGLSTTPTIEMAVVRENAAGGIVLTASHNPKQWNALKLLNHKGEFISGKEGEELIAIAEKGEIDFVEIDKIGKVALLEGALEVHIQDIIKLPLVNVEAIKAKQYRIVVDAVNSTGGFAVPALLRALGVADIIEINCEPTGKFAHNPEPLPEHLGELSGAVKFNKAQLGIV